MHPVIQDILKTQLKNIPEIRPGYTIEVHQKIKEGDKDRIQIFQGLVMKMGQGGGSEKSFTVRKIVEGVGVEKTFPLHSPNIAKILVKKKGEVRRAKLYYMRGRSGKTARLHEVQMTGAEKMDEKQMESLISEAVEAAKKQEKAAQAAAPKEAVQAEVKKTA